MKDGHFASVVLKSGRKWRLISSRRNQNEVVIIGVDLCGGSLINETLAIQQQFQCIQEAVEYLQMHDFEESVELLLDCIVLGYFVIGLEGLLLVATNVQETASMPGCPEHPVFTVIAAEWLSVPLLQPLAIFDLEKGEGWSEYADDGAIADQIRQGELLRQELKDLNINGSHYFCPTLDLTQCWSGGTHQLSTAFDSWEGTSPEFVWNRFLSDSFAEIGLRDVCPVLLRGSCITWPLQRDTGMKVTYLTRQRNTHAGPRYCCRGLAAANGVVGAANDFECEQLVFAPVCRDSSSCTYSAEFVWSHVVWERGSVPVKWMSSITSVVEKISIHPEPYNLTQQYWQQLWARHGTQAFCCVDLLRSVASEQNAGGGPSGVADAAPTSPTSPLAPQESQGQPSTNLYFALPFLGPVRPPPPGDGWGAPADRGPATEASAHPVRAETLLHDHYQRSFAVLPAEQHSVRLCHFDWHTECSRTGPAVAVTRLWALLAPALREYDVACGTLAVQRGCPPDVRCHTQQRGVLRFSCKDCLDRTNLATFFVAMQVLLRQADQVCSLLSEALSDHWRVGPGRPDVVDPFRGKQRGAWAALSASLDAVVQLYPPGAMQDFARAFLEAGDVISLLYANSPASHSGLLRSFAGATAAGRCAFAIGLERHFYAITSERDRQVLTDLWLGRAPPPPGRRLDSEAAGRSVLLCCARRRDTAWAWRVAHSGGAVEAVATYASEAGLRLPAVGLDPVRFLVVLIFRDGAAADGLLRRWAADPPEAGVAALRLSSPAFPAVHRAVVAHRLAQAPVPAAQSTVGWLLARLFPGQRQRRR